MFACYCADVQCTMYGCKQARRVPPPADMCPHPMMPPSTFTPTPLTESDVRRIIREELERSRKGDAS